MQASCSPDFPFHRSIGEIGDCKYFLILILRELSVIQIRCEARIISEGQIERLKAETPKRMTQPPLPHPLRHVVLLGRSLLSVYVVIDEAPVSPITTSLLQSYASTLGNAYAIAGGRHEWL